MKTYISTSIEPGQPDFARSCLVIHDIDFGLVNDGTFVDADACVDFASSINAKEYRYGVLDFPQIPYLLEEGFTETQAEECANGINDALGSLISAFPSVRWTILQLGRIFPFEVDNYSVVNKKKIQSFVLSKTNAQIFSNIVTQNANWACIDLRPGEEDSSVPAHQRFDLCRARASCAISIISRSGWTENIYGCVGKYVWNPRNSVGYIDESFSIQSVCAQLQYFGIGGLLHYHPGSVVWRIHNDNPANDAANGISGFGDMFAFEDAKNSIYNDAQSILSAASGFGNFPSGDPREILLNKLVNDFKGQGLMNRSEHVWHELNNNVSADGFWLRKEDKPPRPNPSDFS